MKGTYASPRDSIPQRAASAPPLSRLSAIVFLLVFCFDLLSAQPVRFERISSESGLPASTIKCIMKDRLGFLWIGTVRGLCPYDGYTFRTFQEDPDNPQSLSGYLVYALLEDKSGTIWIGTIGGGLNKFDPVSETVVHYKHDSANPHSLSSDDVYALFEDRAGRLWIGTRMGLDQFDRTSQKFIHTTLEAESFDASTGTQVTALYELPTHPGILWIGTWNSGIK